MKKKALLLLLVIAMLLPMSLAGCSKEHKVGGQIIIGSTTQLSGDWGYAQWTNNASDKDIRDLINGYSPVAVTKDNEFVYDKNVVKSVDSVVNDDGTKTFTVTLQEDLVWNDGSKITAKDYVAYYLLFASPMIVNDLGATGAAGQLLVGYEDYNDGNATVFSGVRLLGDYQYSVTVAKDYIPYYFDITYADVSPLPRQLWLPNDIDVADDGQGAYFKGDFTAEHCKDTVEAARYASTDRVSCGPYTLKSFDSTSLQAVLEINPNFKGTYDNVKPHVQKIIFVKAEQETMMDALSTGQIDILTSMTDGSEIKTGLDLVENGDFSESHYERNGYGKLMFQCDFGPTQFVEVRHAIVYLLNRDEFANTFCQGFGAVVHGPYGLAMWMYKDAKAKLDKELNTYSFSYDNAVKELTDGGWTLDKDGNAYKSGIRYKEVTQEEAGDYEYNVKLSDGRILMPLIINWASSEGNSVSDLLNTMLAKSDNVKNAGMEIKQTVMTFDELLNYMYRDSSQGDKYGVPTYGMYNLASGFTAAYDVSYSYTLDPDLIAQGYNSNYIYDEQLDKLSMDMVYGVEEGDKETYLSKWTEFIIRWNELLPEVPLYSNIYYDIYNSKLQDYEPNSLWEFSYAIVYSWVKE